MAPLDKNESSTENKNSPVLTREEIDELFAMPPGSEKLLLPSSDEDVETKEVPEEIPEPEATSSTCPITSYKHSSKVVRIFLGDKLDEADPKHKYFESRREKHVQMLTEVQADFNASMETLKRKETSGGNDAERGISSDEDERPSKRLKVSHDQPEDTVIIRVPEHCIAGVWKLDDRREFPKLKFHAAKYLDKEDSEMIMQLQNHFSKTKSPLFAKSFEMHGSTVTFQYQRSFLAAVLK